MITQNIVGSGPINYFTWWYDCQLLPYTKSSYFYWPCTLVQSRPGCPALAPERLVPNVVWTHLVLENIFIQFYSKLRSTGFLLTLDMLIDQTTLHANSSPVLHLQDVLSIHQQNLSILKILHLPLYPLLTVAVATAGHKRQCPTL